MAGQRVNNPFRHQVIVPLANTSRRLKRYVLMEGLNRSLALLVGIAAIQLALDWTLVLGVGPRAALLAALLGIVGYQFYRSVILPASIRVDINDIAAILERKNPDFHDQLLSAVAFSTGAGRNPHRDSPAMIQALVRESNVRFAALSTDGILRRDRYVWHMVLGLAAALIVFAAFRFAPDTLAIYVQRDLLLGNLAWPVRIHIVPEGFQNGKMAWPLGDELTLVATAQDRVPSLLNAELQFSSNDQSIRVMDRRGRNQFILDVGPLMQDMKVRFLSRRFGVDERTYWYAIQAVPRPSVRAVKIRITPPAYTQVKPFVVPAGQASADIIRGSNVRISATFNKPVVKAILRARSDDRSIREASIDGGRRISVAFVPQHRGTFYLDVRDDMGLEDRHPVTYSFSLNTDPAPKVRLTLPGAGEMVVPKAILNLDVDCEDNLGIKRVELIHEIIRESGPAPTTRPSKTIEALPDFTLGQLRYTWTQPFSLLPLTLKAGDQFSLQARGTDFQPPSMSPDVGTDEANEKAGPGGVGYSLSYTLRVVTAEELLTELGRRENEWRREFEQVIKSQEQLNRRIMDLRDRRQGDSQPEQRSIRYGQEGRLQRQQGGRMKTVARQFGQIFSELKVNQLANPSVRRRLLEGVISPLKRLITEEVIPTADLIEHLKLQYDPKIADELEQRQTRIIRSMYGILSNMLKWEGYNEAVGLLRDIVRLQRDLNKDTEARLESEIDNLFKDEAQPAGKPPSEKRP